MSEKKKKVLLVIGLLFWMILAALGYGFNAYIGIAIVAVGAVVFYLLRRGQRKEIEKAAPKEGLYVGFPRGVIYRTEWEIERCISSLEKKSESDPLDYDFSWDSEARTGELALYCRRGSLRPQFPSSFVISFAKRESGVIILVRYLDPDARTSVMTRPDVDGFLFEKCGAAVIGMRKAENA